MLEWLNVALIWTENPLVAVPAFAAWLLIVFAYSIDRIRETLFRERATADLTVKKKGSEGGWTLTVITSDRGLKHLFLRFAIYVFYRIGYLKNRKDFPRPAKEGIDPEFAEGKENYVFLDVFEYGNRGLRVMQEGRFGYRFAVYSIPAILLLTTSLYGIYQMASCWGFGKGCP